jgi:hypothetical protein
MPDVPRESTSALAQVAPRLARAHAAERRRRLLEHPNSTGCRCGHVWRPMAWQERTRNVLCPECGGWNEAGTVDIGLRLAMEADDA